MVDSNITFHYHLIMLTFQTNFDMKNIFPAFYIFMNVKSEMDLYAQLEKLLGKYELTSFLHH